jgi:ParB-like chromosome segregation protein Spo0J
MPIKLKNLFIKRIAVVDSGDNPEADVVMFKAADKKDDIEKGGQEKMAKTFDEIIKELVTEDADIVKGEIEKAKKEMTDAEKAKMMAEMKPAVKKEEEVIAKADPEVKELFKSMQEEITKTKDDLKKQAETLKKAEVTKKVEKFDKLSAPVEDMVEVFMKMDEEVSGKVEAILKAANEQLKDSTVFKNVGTNSGGDQKTALEKVEELAKARTVEKGISIEMARAEIIKENQELVDEYNKEV